MTAARRGRSGHRLVRGIAGRTAALGLRAGSWLVRRIPDGVLARFADLAGLAWYRLAPRRAERARRNLDRVAHWLAAENLGPDEARRAATDTAALEGLVRRAFQHSVRYYLEVAQLPAWAPAFIAARLTVATPDVVDRAFAVDGPMIFIAPHFGAIELPGLYLASRSNRVPVAPMETLADPAIQAYFVRTRGAMGIRIVEVEAARRELLAALRAGDPVGLVADRDLTGGGIPTRFFGADAPLPAGPAILAIQSGAPLYATAVRRAGPGRWIGRLDPIAVPTEGTFRTRVIGTLEGVAAAFERAIAEAPEQWWGAFFPIWPDLATPSPGGADR